MKKALLAGLGAAVLIGPCISHGSAADKSWSSVPSKRAMLVDDSGDAVRFLQLSCGDVANDSSMEVAVIDAGGPGRGADDTLYGHATASLSIDDWTPDWTLSMLSQNVSGAIEMRALLFDKSVLKELVERMSAGKKAVIKVDGMNAEFAFDLKGAKDALAAFSECYEDMPASPAVRAGKPVPASRKGRSERLIERSGN